MASKVYGDFKNLKALFNNLDKNVVGEVKDYLKEEAYDIKEEIQNSIKSQTGNWQSLAKATVENKGHNKILYETGQLVDSIDVQGSGDEYVVAPTGQHTHNISNSELAILHEYGTSKMPPRPIFRPVYEKHRNEVPKEVADIVQKEIDKFK